MNNHLYHWHAEQIAKLERKNLDHALKQVSLIREAGLSSPTLLARVAKALRSLLKSRRERPKDQSFLQPVSYQAMSENSGKVLAPHNE